MSECFDLYSIDNNVDKLGFALIPELISPVTEDFVLLFSISECFDHQSGCVFFLHFIRLNRDINRTRIAYSLTSSQIH